MQGEDIVEGRDEGFFHFNHVVVFFPGSFAVVLCLFGELAEMGDVESAEMLAVGTARHGGEGVQVHFLGHPASNRLKGCDGAVVHDDVTPERERVVVGSDNRGGGSSSDMGEECTSAGICGNALEIKIMKRWLGTLVDGRTRAHRRCKGRSGTRVPSQAKSINVQIAVSGSQLELALLCIWVVRLQSGKEIGVDLLAQRVVRSDKNVFEEALLFGGYVGKPTTHLGMKIVIFYIFSMLAKLEVKA